MKKVLWQQSGRVKGLWAAAAAMLLGLASASAQYEFLAITEVLSIGSFTYRGIDQYGAPDFHQGSDFIEITCFGSNPLDLTGCFFTDSQDKRSSAGFDGLEIHPGESIILFRSQPTRTLNVEQFREWWGSCLSPNVQVVGYPEQVGLDNAEDGVRLYDPQTNLLDRVDFGLAQDGVTFVYATNTGHFGAFSKLGECGACQAFTADDIGSPGTTCGPVPLRILQCPSNVVACPGLAAVFSVRACGLPRPKYQWLRDGTSIPEANAADLTIDDPSSADIGEYRVVVSNGLESLVCPPVTLTVNTNPSPPILYSGLSDVEVFVGETATFAVSVCAVPPPQYQWLSNGVDLAEATSRVLNISDVALETSGTIYSVSISNPLGATNLSARLLVWPSPNLAFTEVMPIPSTQGPSAGHKNWFEVSNRGTNAVNFKRFRHSDSYGLSTAKVVADDLVLLPGESVVLVEQMSREDFIRWWGPENLPPDIKVISYVGYGLSSPSENLYLWSAAAETERGSLAYVGWASATPPPGVPTCSCKCENSPCDVPLEGHSLWFNTHCVLNGMASEEGKNGAFHSVESDDVGSPGWTALTPPCFVSIHLVPSGVVLEWKAPPGSTHLVQCKPSFENPNWTTLGSVTAVGASRTFTDTRVGGDPQRFYRLIGVSP